MSIEFVHLHLHTGYSLYDSTCRIEDVIQLAVEDGMRAVAITDHGVLSGAAEFYRLAGRQGVKPIIGCEVYLSENAGRSGPGYPVRHVILLAENDVGYLNLVGLTSAAHLRFGPAAPCVYKRDLDMFHKGLVCLSGCSDGEVAENLVRGDDPGASRSACELREIFGPENFFLEVQYHGFPEQQMLMERTFGLAERLSIPVVATNDVHYTRREHAESRGILLKMRPETAGACRHRRALPGDQYYFKLQGEMAAVFEKRPDALRNTLAIEERCDVELRFAGLHFPAYRPEDGSSHPRELLRSLCRKGLGWRYGIADPDRPENPDENRIIARLEGELQVVERKGFVNYFLVVWDYVAFARRRDIPIWLRGTGAGSVIAYVLGITEIDPLRYSLEFEPFFNPESGLPPDFDIEFCQARRHEVTEHLRDRYGKERVANISAFATFGSRSLVRDIGRVLNAPHTECDAITALIPHDPQVSLRQALERSAELRRRHSDEYDLCRKIMDHGLVIERLPRLAGVHPSGAIIAERRLAEMLPLTRDREGSQTTQYATESLESLGFLKMDIIGFKTLTLLQKAADLAGESGSDVCLSGMPEDDPEALALLDRGDTIGIFHLESDSMRETLRRIGVERIEDVIAAIALNRPGTADALDEYVRRKNGTQGGDGSHRLLQPILKATHGVIVYHEQVQKAVMALAGYSPAQADMLRRAMCDRERAAIEPHRPRFRAGCGKTHRMDKEKADAFFDRIVTCAGRACSKADSTAQAVLAYMAAFLKANYPVQFMTALLSGELGDSERLRILVNEAVAMGIRILPPDVNGSGTSFSTEGSAIRFGLAGVRRVGRASAELIVHEREASGPYAGILDFLIRLRGRVASRHVMETLVRCGGFDGFGLHRARLMKGLDAAMAMARSVHRDADAGQGDLFFEGKGPKPDDDEIFEDCAPWEESKLLADEKELLWACVSGHPLSANARMVERYGTGMAARSTKGRVPNPGADPRDASGEGRCAGRGGQFADRDAG